MKKYDLRWTDADAKFAEALLLATGGEGSTSLQDALLMGDALNGTVFSLSEVEQALIKLTAIRYLQIQKNKLSLTPDFVAEHGAASTAVPDISEAERLQELLKCHELSEEKIIAAEEQVKKYKLKNYYQQYQEQFG